MYAQATPGTMTPSPRKLKVALFCGGNGAKNIISALLQHPLFEVTAIVNAYDDGLSTGYLRKLIPEYLGPSDVRKNMSYMIDTTKTNKRILKDLLEYRFPKGVSNEKALQDLYNIIQQRKLSLGDLDVFIKKVVPEDAVYLRIYLKSLLDYLASKRIKFDFDDCSFGNLLLTGCYLKNNQDFNTAISELHAFLGLRGKVVNVTRGENLFLAAITKEGEILPSEASIIERRANAELDEIFLLPQYLKEKEITKLKKYSYKKKIAYLRAKEVHPLLGDDARQTLEEADILLYAPGTQNSSLFPTYVTKGLAELLVRAKCKKIFISNIGEDNEIPSATVEDIIEKAVTCLNRKGEISYSNEQLFDYYFVNAGNAIDPKYIKFANRLQLPNVVYENFEEGFEGKHSGAKVVEKLMQIAHEGKVTSRVKKLSIVIPGYNEGRFAKQLIEKIKAVDFSSLGVITEIVYVNNGSTDETAKVLEKIPGIQIVTIRQNKGKGDGVIRGIEATTGDIIVIQDADLEYTPEDIKEMLRVMLQHTFMAVYGSRTIKKGMRHKALSILYGKQPGAYWSFYLGGQLLSFITFLLYGSFITDTVTGYKMVRAKLLKSFALKSKGFELDHEITAKVLKAGYQILEVPASYTPRSVQEGKKIKWKDGLIAIKTLFKFRFSN